MLTCCAFLKKTLGIKTQHPPERPPSIPMYVDGMACTVSCIFLFSSAYFDDSRLSVKAQRTGIV